MEIAIAFALGICLFLLIVWAASMLLYLVFYSILFFFRLVIPIPILVRSMDWMNRVGARFFFKKS